MSLTGISLYRFKNHFDFQSGLGASNVVLGPNGAGKSNLLESIYLLVNGILPPGRDINQALSDEADSGFVRGGIELDSGLVPEFAVTLNRSPSKLGYLIQGDSVTRPKYLARHGLRAVLFTPIEMNLLYLWPALRRDFLDEILLLSHTEFLTVRREYLAALRSRNALLKRIAEGKASPSDLDAWDLLFVQKATRYYSYRKRIVEKVSDSIERIVPKVRSGLRLSFEYQTKVPLSSGESAIAESIATYLASHREKDIWVGHTCIGPHLDDFACIVESSISRPTSADYLSRGENKTILAYLKMLGIEYIEVCSKSRIVLLLDDIASELDAEHFSAIVDGFGERPFFLSGHRIPERFFHESVTMIDLSAREASEKGWFAGKQGK